jgi:LytS/YehU family sensor histidine kinase
MTTSVPVMVVQIFVENAIKHGIMPLANNGRVDIKILREGEYLRIVITDNGVGRAKAALLQPAGVGLRITDEFYEILNQVNPGTVRYTIEDLVDDQKNPLGTRVDVWVRISSELNQPRTTQ